MSSKKSRLKPSWLEAEGGNGYVLATPQKFQESHNESMKNDHFQSATVPAISSDGVLKAQVFKMKEKDLKLTENLKNSIVEVHPETMDLCGMRLGGPVLVSAQNSDFRRETALRAWPSISVPLGKTAVSETQLQALGLQEDDFVYIQRAESRCACDVTMKIICESDSSLDVTIAKSSYFSQYIQQILDRRYLVAGQQVDVNYFGRVLSMVVVGAKAGDEKMTDLEETNADLSGLSQLNESLVNLSIQSAGDTNANDSSFSKQNRTKQFNHISDLTSTPKQGKHSPEGDNYKNSSTAIPTNVRNFEDSNEPFIGSDCVFQINKHTKISLVNTQEHPEGRRLLSENQEYFGTDTYKGVGGLQPQIEILKEMVELPMLKPHLFTQSGLSPPTGVLLHGPPGTGKSMLVKACVNESNVRAVLLQGASIMSRYFGDSEQKLRDLFDKAREQAPSVIVIDEIDAICPQRDSSRSDVEKRLVSSFITLLDGVTAVNRCSSKYVVILATTNRIDAIDPALRRAGRFDREIEIPIPSPDDRVEIFNKLLSQMKHNLQPDDITLLAEKAHGYVGADIAAVCKEAGMRALRSGLDDTEGSEDQIMVKLPDFEFGLKQVPPSAMRELIVQVPKVLWSDIGGNAEVKKKLKQAIEWPLKNPQAFQRLGIEPPRGVLLYGPPGCSKTLTARALATESGLNFISIKGPELFSKYVGDSERAIRRIFSKARSAAPSIIFFDELDALAIERGGGSSRGGGNVADRVLAALLTEMDGVEQRRDVIVVAATNRPDMIDKALLRPGRIDRIVHVPLPDQATRRDILRLQFRKTPIASDVDLDWLVQKTEKYSGAEICAVCREAALSALDDDMEAAELTSRDFERALSTVLPQTTDELVRMYEEYSKTLQSTIKR